jgi:hypothetical protein
MSSAFTYQVEVGAISQHSSLQGCGALCEPGPLLEVKNRAFSTLELEHELEHGNKEAMMSPQ